MPALGREAADYLHSWKEIAAYLRHSVRTVQRWEQTEALPVHRHAHEKRDAVYAYKCELDSWWKERAARLEGEAEGRAGAVPVIELPAPRREATSRRGWLMAGAALLAMAATGIWFARSGGRAALSFAPRDWVLITDFDNQTGEPLFDKSLWAALTVSLQQSTHVNVVSRTRIDAALRRMEKDPETSIGEALGREICLRENARALITCAISKAGRQYGLSARLVDPHTGETLRAYFERARDQDEVLGSLGRIIGGIRGDLGESLASIRRCDRPLPQVTTPSLQALRLYAEGGYLWRKRQHGEALKLFQSALELDPDFAMAHAALASAYLSHIYFAPGQGKEHFEKALHRAGRITDRERLHIQASYHGSLNHVEEAVRFYELYLADYPDDLRARQSFGNLLMLNDRLQKAVEQFQEVVRLAPGEASGLIGLASSYRLVGKPDEALAHYAKAFELEPAWVANGNLNHEYGFGWAQSGDLSKARDVFALALAKPDMKSRALRSLALLDMYQGRYRNAKARLREAILLNLAEREPLRQARNHLYTSILLDGQGDTVGRLRELDCAVQALERVVSTNVWLSAYVGAAYARAGAARKAEHIRRRLSRQLDQSNPKDRSLVYLLEGELALARNDYARAIERLQIADREARTPVTVAALAHAQQKAGLSEQAIASYEMLVGMGHLALGWEPQQTWIAAHAALTEAYLSRGERPQAARVLNTLTRLWREADRDLPLVKRIERLQERLQRGN